VAPAHFDPRAAGDARLRRVRHRAVEMPMHAMHFIGAFDARSLL
jgi:hypothetical protein